MRLLDCKQILQWHKFPRVSVGLGQQTMPVGHGQKTSLMLGQQTSIGLGKELVPAGLGQESMPVGLGQHINVWLSQ